MDNDDAYRRAKTRAGNKLGFLIHLGAYLAVNAGLVAINLAVTPDRLWFQWPLLGWGLGVLAHGVSLYCIPDLHKRMTERELRKEGSKSVQS